MLPKLLQTSVKETKRGSLEQLEVDRARENLKGTQFGSGSNIHRDDQIDFHSQSNHKTLHFEHIETCSHSELSLIDEEQRQTGLQPHLYHKAGSNEQETQQGIELRRRIQREGGKGTLRQEDERILRANSNSMQIRINWYQTQQIHTNDNNYKNSCPTQRTIIISSPTNPANLNQNLQCVINSFNTVKNLNRLNNLEASQTQQVSVFKQYYLEDMNTKHNLQDLENKSSCSSEHQQELNEIWDKSQYEVNEIEGLRERQVYSSSSESEQEEEKSEGDSGERLRAEYNKIVEMNDELSRENQHLKNELQSANQRIKIYQHKIQQYDFVKDQNSQKYEQLQLENKELNDLILDYKREAYSSELTLKQLASKVALLEQELTLSKRKAQQSEEQLTALASLLQEKNAEIEDYAIVNRQLEEYLSTKAGEYEEQTRQLQREINRLKETIEFYKERLEQEGFTFNLDEIKRIKEILEFQTDQEQQAVISLSKSYQQQLAKLQHQNQLYASTLSSINLKASQSCSKHYRTHFDLLQLQTQDIIAQYDLQLEARDEEILGLKQQLLQHQQIAAEINLHGCRRYIQKVDRLSQLILAQKLEKYSPCELVMQFLYVVDKVSRMFLATGKQSQSLKKENMAWKDIVQQKDKLFNEEVERANQKISQLQTEIYLLKQLNAQLMESIKVIRHRQKSLQKQKNQKELAIKPFSKAVNCQQMEVASQREGRDMFLEPILPNTSRYTFQQLLSDNRLNLAQKIKLTSSLISLAKEVASQRKRLISLQPKNLEVISTAESFRLELLSTGSKRSDESEKCLIYCAPEVLLGFSQSEHSYVWTIGLIVDYLFHSSMLYKKINEVTSRADNYYCRDQGLPLRRLLESMMKKKQKERCTLEQAQGILAALQ